MIKGVFPNKTIIMMPELQKELYHGSCYDQLYKKLSVQLFRDILYHELDMMMFLNVDILNDSTKEEIENDN